MEKSHSLLPDVAGSSGGLLVLFVFISAFAQNEITSINKARIAINLFSNSLFFLTVGLISYLLFALFIVSHVTFFHFGALREAFVNAPQKNTPTN